MSKSFMLLLSISSWSASAVRSGPANQHEVQDPVRGLHLHRSTTTMSDNMLNYVRRVLADGECEEEPYDSRCLRDKLHAAYPNAWDVYWMEDRTTADTFMLQTVFVDYMQHWTRAYFKTQYESPGRHLLIFTDRKSRKCA
ncbi:unnamed protein product [Symbiodinium necroappetens]|uniref:Uncharacterized protein n=1 Tax=Symbiodinium necroappetens TaxID=1628268 RepID=A0A812VF61_9DINO|nr:unnamed protein product [Symbiodinium necroappetens]